LSQAPACTIVSGPCPRSPKLVLRHIQDLIRLDEGLFIVIFTSLADLWGSRAAAGDCHFTFLRRTPRTFAILIDKDDASLFKGDAGDFPPYNSGSADGLISMDPVTTPGL
jgi:hypothetical protein